MLMNSPWPSMEALFPSSSKRYLGNYVDPNALIKWAQLKLKEYRLFILESRMKNHVKPIKNHVKLVEKSC